MRRRTVADLASAATAVVVIAAAVIAAVDAASRGSLSGGSLPEDSLNPAFQAALAVGWAVPGIVLARRRRTLPFWILAQLAAVTHAAAAILIAVGPDDQWAVWVASWLIVVELPAQTAMVQLFPTGRALVRWRPYLVVSVALGLLGVAAVAVEAIPEIDEAIADVAGLVAVPLLAFTAIGGVVPLAVRYRRTTGGERQAVTWLLVILGAGLVVPAMVAAGGSLGEVAAQMFTVGQLMFMTVAVLRYRVWGLAPMMQRSLQRVISATDAERRRMRAELHDGVGAELTAVRLKVDAAFQLLDQRPQRAAEILDSASADIGSVLDEVRRLVDGLRPAVLDRMTLGAALRQRADELSAHSPGLSITVFEADELVHLVPGADVAVYRLVTEAMNNVVRHAAATHCEVRVSVRGDEIVIDVSDDGSGPITERSDGVGLSSMAARAAEVGGYLVAGADPERGYRVQAVIPKAAT